MSPATDYGDPEGLGDENHRLLLAERLGFVIAANGPNTESRVGALMAVLGPILSGFESARVRLSRERSRAQEAEERAQVAEDAVDAALDALAGREGAGARFSRRLDALDCIRQGKEPPESTARRELLVATAAIRLALTQNGAPDARVGAALSRETLQNALHAVELQKAEMILRDGVTFRHTVQCWRSARYRGTACSCARVADGLLWAAYSDDEHEHHTTPVDQLTCSFIAELDNTQWEFANDRLWAAVEFAWSDAHPTPEQLEEVRTRLQSYGFEDTTVVWDLSHAKIRIRYQFVPKGQ